MVENLGAVFSNRGYLEGLMEAVDYEGNYRFAKEHDWGRCVREYVRLYEEVAGL